MDSTYNRVGRLSRFIPALRWVHEYQTSWLSADLAAGITLGALMVPVGLAFGELAGVPMAGLYAGMLPLIAYAIFGSSRQLIVGPDATMAAFVAVSVAPLAGGDAGRLAVLASILAILVGLACILGSFLRLGFVADLLAKPVVAGFMLGLAAVIAIGQLPKVLGVPGGGETSVDQFLAVCRNVSGTNFISLGIGASCVAIILSCRRWCPRIPGQIVALVGSILVVYFLKLDQSGVAVVGDIPGGLPGLQIPTLSVQDVQALLPVALAAALLAFSDTVVTASGFASRNHYHIDTNQEMLALGMGNISAGLTQSLPISGSGSRTAAAESTGSRSQITSVVAACTVAFVMLCLTSLLYSLPSAALGGILIAAAWNLCDFKEFQRMWRFRRAGMVNSVLAFMGVVGFGVMQGIGIGVLCSLIILLKAVTLPDDAVLGQTESGEFRDRKRHPEAKTIPGLIVYRFMGPLFFANCRVFQNRAAKLIETSPDPLYGFVLDASGILDVDLAACESLSEFHEQLRDRGIRLVIANLRGNVQERLVIGWEAATTVEGLFAANVDAAVRDLHQTTTRPEGGAGGGRRGAHRR